MKIHAFLLAILPLAAFGDDLDSVLATSAPANGPVYATFKGIRVVESQSVETTRKGELNGTISHRFGQWGLGGNDLWGLDFASMRLGLDYGFTDWTDIGFERATNDGKPIDLFLKQRLLRLHHANVFRLMRVAHHRPDGFNPTDSARIFIGSHVAPRSSRAGILFKFDAPAPEMQPHFAKLSTHSRVTIRKGARMYKCGA